MMMRARKGFTLLELMIVISIILILAGIVFYAIFRTKAEAERKAAKIEIMQMVAGMNAYNGAFKNFPYNYDNFDGNPAKNGYKSVNNENPDFGLSANANLRGFLQNIAANEGEAERDIVVANIIAVWALSYQNKDKDIGPFVSFSEEYLVWVGEFTDNNYAHIDNDRSKPFKSKYGLQAYMYVDPWHKPYVIEIKWRWYQATNPNTGEKDEHDYIGRYFCTQDAFNPGAGKPREFWRRAHWSDSARTKIEPVDIWSRGPDGKADPKNNGLDDNFNNKVDEPEELVDDIVSWPSPTLIIQADSSGKTK